MSTYVKVKSGSSIEINRWIAILEENKIPNLIKNAHESGRLAGFGTSGGSVDLYVQEADIKKVEELFH
ncbi:putative signal transducing protein [Nonlabens dokdonensis]|jgi:hypothetical protein|uniref:Uncharacterized protein n=2 Tax=Nonlabens dokdonensis TaxID=328515 RepID=L7WCN9_NONDD|nr:DUF2007 domain-containing protein [Nonlabens dokdonensis]AGC77834.1 hypothetical protein DDD_2707 [Nonlabens dokdonensis DSW-6]PZX39635.1 putative signal transducing protein [Nonlabens dokdonensis]